ncbi:MAG TPA: phosphotransferase [Thermomicrobiales bacterium]|nr:phosphotransferase [Thermomicrobiales bacterium]
MDQILHDDLLTWLTTNGYPATSQLSPLQPGLGSNEIWKLDPGPAGATLIVRVFGFGHEVNARRERAAMVAARSDGIPAPDVLMAGLVRNRPVLVTTFMPGRLAVELLLTSPDSAVTLGTSIGETFGQLHLITAPPDLERAPGAWPDLAGEAIDPIRPILATLPHQDRLLHLDYHPRNVLVEHGTVSGVIDWENTHAGPPHADVGRTLAILRVLQLADLVPPAAIPVLEAFGAALVTGHDRITGPSPAPIALMAWGLAMTAVDLGRQAGKPGNAITATALARLADERDAAITAALERA